MSHRPNSTRSLLRKIKLLFFTLDGEDKLEEFRLEGGVAEEDEDEGPLFRGEDDGKSDYWYDRQEEEINQNAERSRKNEMMLSRLDYRTVWIMRILVSVATAGAVGYVADLVPV